MQPKQIDRGAAGGRGSFSLRMLPWLLPLLLSVHAGEPRPGDPPTPTDPFEGQTVMDIDIRPDPLQRVDVSTVLRLIRTRKGRPYERKVWDEDFHRLDESGYFLNVRMTEPVIAPGGVRLLIDLVEKASIRKISFTGNKGAGRTKLLAEIKSHEGGRFDKGQVHLDKVAIEKYYQEKAYRDVKVDYEIEVVSSHKQMIGNREADVEDEVNVTFKVDEANPVAVRTIKFKGNKSFSGAQLRAAMQTRARRMFRAGDLKDEELDFDKHRLEAFYLRHGYIDIAVEKVEVDLSKESYFNWFRKRKRLADITITVNEGPQYYTGKLEITGNANMDLNEILATIKVKPGAVFSDLLLQDDLGRIIDLYGERGRVFTKADYDRKLVTDPVRTKENPNQYDVFWTIREGGEVSVREVITRGNTKTKDKVVIRELPLFPGDRIDTSKIKHATQSLKNLNYFEDDVRITPEPTENPEEANVVIDVVEKNTGEFNFGIGVSSVDSIVGNIRLAQRNFDYKDWPKSWRDLISGNAFVGAGQQFSVEAQGGAERQRYSISLFEPWAFDRPIRLGGSVFHSVDNFRDFKQTDTGMSLSAGKRLWGPRWDGSVTYRVALTQIGDIGIKYPPILREQEGDNFVSSMTPRLVYDSRDSRLLASRGWLAEASLEIGGGPFFGDYNWVRPRLDVARYLTMFKLKNGGKHILELRGVASAVEAYGETNEVPPFLRFYAGGIDTIRGFQYRTITPYENHYRIGGKQLAVGTAEYTLPLYEEVVRGALFVDGGTVSDAGKTDPRTRVTNEGGLRATVGFGFAIRTPFSPLPIRVYVSRPIVKNEGDRTKLFDFTFGTRF